MRKSTRQSRYTDAQRKAYETGRAYRLGREDRAIEFKNGENYKSFRAGFNSVDLKRYPKTGTSGGSSRGRKY